MGVAEVTMGRQHPSEPVTKADKAMSKRHKKHRAEIAKIKDKRQQLIASSRYNLPHAAEHIEQHKKNVKELAKIAKKSPGLAR